MGAYISNQVRMHACHLILNHCIMFFIEIFQKKILNEVQPCHQEGLVSVLQSGNTKKFSAIPLGIFTFQPYH